MTADDDDEDDDDDDDDDDYVPRRRLVIARINAATHRARVQCSMSVVVKPPPPSLSLSLSLFHASRKTSRRFKITALPAVRTSSRKCDEYQQYRSGTCVVGLTKGAPASLARGLVLRPPPPAPLAR